MKTLKQFYREIQAWIDAGCPEHDVFYKDDGICIQLELWPSYHEDLSSKMKQSFRMSGLDEVYPFNEGSPEDYLAEEDYYKNPARLAWIKEHAA